MRLAAKDLKVVPWKNGGGTTTEVAVFPVGMTVADPFLWRVSLAEIKGDGPFSTFAGYDRTIVQLDGPAMTLVHGSRGEHGQVTLAPLVAHRFSGDWATIGTLAAPGIAHDLNVMTRRGVASSVVAMSKIAPRKTASVAGDAGGTLLIYLARGELVIDGCEALKPGDFARYDATSDQTRSLRAGKHGAELLQIALRA